MMSLVSDYPNPYENTAYDNYPDPYRSAPTNTYNESSNYQDQEYRDSGYSDYYQDNRYNNDDNNSNKSSDQEERERDRINRRNRSERRRELRRDDRRDERRDDRRDDRDRHHSDRDSSRSRDRARDRDNDRGGYERDRESRDRRDRDIDERAGEKWLTDTPTNTIILRGLPQCIEEKDIKAELMLFGAPVKDVRLMRKSTGASRGFAFVEFHIVDDALRWMDSNQQRLTLQNQYQCSMNFSSPKDPNYKQLVHKMDWTCVKCGVHNFKRRDYCFKCNMSRYESGKAQAEGFDHIGTNPCNTLLFRGLDALTTEENLLQALNSAAQMTCKNMQVIKDQATSASMGFAFVELSSVAESMNVLEILKALNPPFEVDGKQILVSFAKNTFNTSIAAIAAAAAQPAWDQSSEFYQGYEYNQQSGYLNDGQYDYSSYYGSDSATATTSSSVDSTNAAAAVAQAAIQQAQAAKNYQKQVQQQQKIAEMSKEEQLAHQAQEWKQKSQETKETKSSVTKYPPPDVSLYQYDETSGYYYDPITTLYYDANSQYYYNGQTGQFMYWDAEQSTYLPAPTSPEDGATAGTSPDMANKMETKEEKKETKEKKEKVKVAKKIAMDMEKWAKSMNAQKEAFRDGMKKINMPNLSGKKESATADAGFAILEKTKAAGSDEISLMPPPSMPGVGITSPSLQKASPRLVASYGGDSDDEEEDQDGTRVDDKQLVDLSKMACLLCKRQFQTKDQLMRHTQMSDLHKQNLEKLQQSSPGSSSSLQYRDRAKERREKIGSTAPPAKKRPAAADDSFEQPTKAGIGSDNIGSKMLQKMGWSSGQGLGKAGQGIVNPIQAERRSASAGLGMRGASYNIEDTDNYKDALRKTMFARYNEVE